MKKNKFLLLVFIGLLTFSCGSDDDASVADSTTAQDQSLLMGTWYLTARTDNGVDDLATCDVLNNCTFETSLVTTVEYSGTSCSMIDTEELNYVVVGNILTVSDGNFSDSVEISSITATTLVLRYVDGGDVILSTFVKV